MVSAGLFECKRFPSTATAAIEYSFLLLALLTANGYSIWQYLREGSDTWHEVQASQYFSVSLSISGEVLHVQCDPGNCGSRDLGPA